MIRPKYYYVPPVPLRTIFKSVIWNSTNDHILLSIDDGPSVSETTKILNTLRDSSVKALFFVTTDAAIKNRHLVNEILAQGHSIGNHSFSHKRLRFVSGSILKREIVDSKSAIEDATGTPIMYFRPPYGAFDPFVLKAIKKSGQKCVMWSLLSGDFLGSGSETEKVIKNYLNPDSIVVYHDNFKSRNTIIESLISTIQTANEKDLKLEIPQYV
ncbi:MAG: polysaccharide deacetylase family protein [Ignavibacteriales bacterium]|nr:polysaccharide deacetylase family protein [Ignavibacteriales bacterium]